MEFKYHYYGLSGLNSASMSGRPERMKWPMSIRSIMSLWSLFIVLPDVFIRLLTNLLDEASLLNGLLRLFVSLVSVLFINLF